MELTDEVSITLTLAEWQQIRAILTEQTAIFQAQIARNNSTIEKIDDAFAPREKPKVAPLLVS